jgi:hypothetical protein
MTKHFCDLCRAEMEIWMRVSVQEHGPYSQDWAVDVCRSCGADPVAAIRRAFRDPIRRQEEASRAAVLD